MRIRTYALFAGLLFLAFSGCGGARLSHDEARRRIAEIGNSKIVPQAIDVQRIVAQTETTAIAETTVAMTFQFAKDKASGTWQVSAVRLGAEDWLDMKDLAAAVQDSRRRTTVAVLTKLAAGIESYRKANNTALPPLGDIVKLTDVLHPQYMTDLIRSDAWGHTLLVEPAASGYRLFSSGPDGIRGNADDVDIPR